MSDSAKIAGCAPKQMQPAVDREKHRLRSLQRYSLAVGALMLFGLYIRREALWAGFFADDYAQLGMLDGNYPVPRAPYDLFSFSDGSAAEAQKLMQSGFYPWWADPELRIAMLRPLASLMIWFDHRMFGNEAFFYHVHSAVWWFAMLGAVALLFRRLLPMPQALVAFTLLVCDEAHGVALSWICNRCAVVSTTFSLIALLLYIRFRRAGGTRWLVAAIVAYSVAFGFGEYSICALGYLVAYEVFSGLGTIKARLRAFLPMLLPPLVFSGVRSLVGATVLNSGVYVDPVTEPLAFAGAVAVRLPVLMSDLVLALRADYWTFGAPWTYVWFDRGWVPRRWVHDPEPWRLVQLGVGVLACGLLVLLARTTLQGENQRNTRWLALGSVLSVIPVCGSFPSSRLLLVPLVGFTPLLAAFIVAGFQQLRANLRTRPRRSIALAMPALLAALYHVIIPIDAERTAVARTLGGTTGLRDAILGMHVDEARLPRQDLILLTALEGGTSMYLPLTRLLYGHAAPHSCLYLSYVTAPYLLSRDAPNAFTMRFNGTYAMLGTAGEHLLRSPKRPFRVHDTVVAGFMRVTILELFEGRPRRIRFEFDRPLEDPSLLFMVPARDGYHRFELPAVGDARVVPPPTIPSAQAPSEHQASRS
jgi:hypothetical protein